MFYTTDIAVPLQNNLVAVNTDNAVHHIATALNPRQDNITYCRNNRFDEDDTLLATDDKRQHTTAFHGKSDTQSVIHQGYGTLYDFFIRHLQYLQFTIYNSLTFLGKGGRQLRRVDNPDAIQEHT